MEDVKFVINYDYPNSSEDYIHRIGRTARSQKTGTAYTFFTPNNMKQAGDLISVLREANQAINPKLIQMAEDRGGKTPPRGEQLEKGSCVSPGNAACLKTAVCLPVAAVTRCVTPVYMLLCPITGSVCLHVIQVVEGGGEVASRMIAVIGILGVRGAAMVATGTGTMIGDLVGDQKVALVALRSRMVLAVVVMGVTLVVVMGTTTIAAVMDRDISELQQIRWVPLEIRASRAPHSLGACRGPLKMG